MADKLFIFKVSESGDSFDGYVDFSDFCGMRKGETLGTLVAAFGNLEYAK